MKPEQLAKIKARCDAATPGKWFNESGVIHAPGWHLDAEPGSACHPADTFNGNGLDWNADAEFIAHARQDIPELLAYIQELQDDWEGRDD